MSESTVTSPAVREREVARVDQLREHPRNYRDHPERQLEHLAQSIREHGLYRNVVVARDGTILAGHGVVLAAKRLGMEELPVVRLPIGPDDPKALKILTADNELGMLAGIDDRGLTELLREIRDVDIDGLFGTGYDEAMLAQLVFKTRSREEIATEDDAGAWVGLPDYGVGADFQRLIITFETAEERQQLLDLIGATDRTFIYRKEAVWSIRWPLVEGREDLSSLRFE